MVNIGNSMNNIYYEAVASSGLAPDQGYIGGHLIPGHVWTSCINGKMASS